MVLVSGYKVQSVGGTDPVQEAHHTVHATLCCALKLLRDGGGGRGGGAVAALRTQLEATSPGDGKMYMMVSQMRTYLQINPVCVSDGTTFCSSIKQTHSEPSLSS